MSDPVSELRAALGAAAAALRGSGSETDLSSGMRLERPKRAGQGDYATNAAMLLAPALGAPPREIAAQLGDRLGAILGDALTGHVSPLLFLVSLCTAAVGIALLGYELHHHRSHTRALVTKNDDAAESAVRG